MDQFVQIMGRQWDAFVLLAPRIIAAAMVLILSYFAGRLLGGLLLRILKRFADQRLPTAFFKAVLMIASLFIGSVIALQILGLERVALSLIAGGGVTAIVLGFAFREIGENLLAGLFLAFSRPFNLGDTIQSEDIEGVVKAIELRNTHLRTVDGRDVFVPSAQLFTRPVTNFTRDGLRRLSFYVGIDYAHDAEKACADIGAALQDVPGPLSNPPIEVHVVELLPNYVQLSVFFWVDVFDTGNPVAPMRDRLMNATRATLRKRGYTLSSEVSTTVEVSQKPGRRSGENDAVT